MGAALILSISYVTMFHAFLCILSKSLPTSNLSDVVQMLAYFRGKSLAVETISRSASGRSLLGRLKVYKYVFFVSTSHHD